MTSSSSHVMTTTKREQDRRVRAATRLTRLRQRGHPPGTARPRTAREDQLLWGKASGSFTLWCDVLTRPASRAAVLHVLRRSTLVQLFTPVRFRLAALPSCSHLLLSGRLGTPTVPPQTLSPTEARGQPPRHRAEVPHRRPHAPPGEPPHYACLLQRLPNHPGPGVSGRRRQPSSPGASATGRGACRTFPSHLSYEPRTATDGDCVPLNPRTQTARQRAAKVALLRAAAKREHGAAREHVMTTQEAEFYLEEARGDFQAARRCVATPTEPTL